MESPDMDNLVRQLTAGFEALQTEYQKLHGAHLALEKKLATARQQYNNIAKLYGTELATTPPLSLASTTAHPKLESQTLAETSDLLEKSTDQVSREAAGKVRIAAAAARRLKDGLVRFETASHGVRIWSGPAADRPEVCGSTMPSISESPLEQDFTVPGTPSRLGCPFASMHRKKLSSHAASVLSRYNQTGSIGAASTPLSTASRINGRDSASRRSSRRESFVDPIKAEICGLSDHHATTSPMDIPAPKDVAKDGNADVGVCPIRFLDQHSPEEVATYFEKHKHELPRSHEVCVMRYQSNEAQIKQLDQKYGNIVSMIKGLGEKHKTLLPKEPEDMPEDEFDGGLSDDKVRKWASSVSGDAAEMDVDVSEDRQPHFERPLRDIRVGESPSRPWGISVPAKYLEEVASGASSKPALVSPHPVGTPTHEAPRQAATLPPPQDAPRCPFGHGPGPKPPGHNSLAGTKGPHAEPIVLERTSEPADESQAAPQASEKAAERPQMVFTGPVFIGYSPEDAAKFLKETGIRIG